MPFNKCCLETQEAASGWPAVVISLPGPAPDKNGAQRLWGLPEVPGAPEEPAEETACRAGAK